jgi:hypothetical protein
LFREAFDLVAEKQQAVFLYAEVCGLVDEYLMAFQYRSMTVYINEMVEDTESREENT